MLAWCDFPLSLYTDYANPGQPPVNEVNHFSCVRREKRLRRRRRNDDDGVRATRSAKSDEVFSRSPPWGLARGAK